jgi:ectoine hydroxylase-related dioxygenase (phytanoyl-CoA dioxygenase family)
MSTATAARLARLTDAEKADFQRDGFIILRGAMDAEAIARFIPIVEHLDALEHERRQMAADEFTEVRNAIAKDHRLLELLTWPTVFPIVADLMGPDISLCTSHALVRPPARPGTPADFKASGWHKDGGAQIPAVHGTCPWLYTKVGFFLTDLSQPGRGNLRVIPGSHLKAVPPGKSDPTQIDPDGAIEVLTRPGDVVIFQQALWHSVGPNTSTAARKNIYLGYSQRWLRPIDFQFQDPSLMAKADPIQRQLLGEYASECTFYLPQADDVPLRPWLDAYRRGAPA